MIINKVIYLISVIQQFNNESHLISSFLFWTDKIHKILEMFFIRNFDTKLKVEE